MAFTRRGFAALLLFYTNQQQNYVPLLVFQHRDPDGKIKLPPPHR
jgi:hypothetical protein